MKNKIKSILEGINENAFERQEAIGLSLLSALAGESIFILGLPGVGKSMIARRLKLAFEDARVFEYLMSRFSTPDEIFGPVSISGLKEHDRYERVTQGYLPEAEVVFLDEIWKAGPAIQNSLLTVLNEKVFLNGNREMRLPVKAIIAASNELPAQGEGLEALWDRFLIRYIVEPIKRKHNFFKLLEDVSEESMPDIPTLSQEEYLQIRIGSRNVVVPEKILNLLFSLREKFAQANLPITNEDDVNPLQDDEREENKFYISDRRWKKTVGVLKTSAYLNGRTEVNLSDTLLLGFMLWNEDSQISDVNRMIGEAIVAVLFEEVLNGYRAGVRRRSEEDSQPFSPDGKNYVIECDDYPLKISKKDYNRLKQNPRQYFFGSETKNGQLILGSQGQFTVKFVREGVLCLNSFTFPLHTVGGSDSAYELRQSLELESDNLIRSFEQEIKENLFVMEPAVLQSVYTTAKMYRNRFNKL